MLKRAIRESINSNDELSSSSDSDLSSDVAANVEIKSNRGWKVALVGSRGISADTRRLIKEFEMLLPHSKKESKFEGKNGDIKNLVEVCELSGCDFCAFFSESKDRELSLMLADIAGPTIKYSVKSVFRSDELFLKGNSAKNTRPLLLFSPKFEENEIYQKHKFLLSKAFGCPINHRRARPFFDRIFYFTILDNHILFRNYEVNPEFKLEEIGPRFVLEPILVFEGAFKGRILWKSPLPKAIKSSSSKKAIFGAKLARRGAASKLNYETKQALKGVEEPEYEEKVFK